MKSFKVLALAVIFAATLALPALAQQPEKFHLHLDPATTEVHYTLKDTLHTVKGTFHLTAGDIVFNSGSGDAHGQFTVDTGSGVSGNDTRDGKMKREYLEVPKFPVATFDAQKVTGYNPSADNQTVTVAGTMMLHGGAHPLTLTFTVNRSGSAVTATTLFMIPYVEWGIKNPSIAFVKVEKEVTMDIVAKGTLTAEK